ncbi:MAG: transketolase [Oceanospirillales bacterium]|nr:transketolase [Oceanospirillales bacterium]MCH1449380.1 transketolase [Litorivicinaceae bacterium]MDA8665610.1 transketolase [Litorivicinaceae bacterium]HBC48591.1 transketolase [Gammaproteobacteria bacterium]HBZ91855.1 transketolase [Gammaproteobacteria bacterium]
MQRSQRQRMADAIRFLAMDGVQAANSGHPGMPMGMADAAVALFADHIHVDPTCPTWPDRDRFILSAGHGSMLHYALNHLLGYKDMDAGQLKQFRQLGARTAGHPEYGHADGIETTTGPLGQGITTAVGMALAERRLASQFGRALVDHYTYVIAGDGCLMEGISHEAIDMAGHLKLGRLIVLWDDNDISIDGNTDIATSTNQLARFKAAGWQVTRVDGHDSDAVSAAIDVAKKSRKPSLIACKTVIGFGAPTLAGSHKTHGAPLGDDEIQATRTALGWDHPPFEIPSDIRSLWQEIATRGLDMRTHWQSRLDSSVKKSRFERAMSGELPKALATRMRRYKKQLKAELPKVASRQASQMALEVINAAVPTMVGGSADLTGSNLTKTSQMRSITPGNYRGNYVHYGIREHAMGAVMNGMALHGGMIPYGGTFLVFSDYMRGSMRLSALMKQRVIYVLTHDSIGLGEDGPTHQPIEHLAMLRATPNMNVYRPCDAVETAEAWEIALESSETPSVMALSRQGLPTVRTERTNENLTQKGGYILRNVRGARDITVMATGSEVAIALDAADVLKDQGYNVAVVSMPCWELFDQQSDQYRQSVLGSAPRIAIEALIGFGWDRYLRTQDVFIGMHDFGASGPAPELYQHFGITKERICETAHRLIERA